MLTCEEIEKIRNGTEKEKVTNEFKSFRKLFDSDNRDSLTADFVAMANRFGGKFFIGINDDGNFDEKGKYNLDEAKELIHQICYDKISPRIECSTTYVDCEKGDVLVASIPKKKKVPHAVVRKNGSEILSRKYYIRTSHGKRLVTDAQLEWLFTQDDDPDYRHSVRIGVEWDNSMQTQGGKIPWGNYHVSSFINAQIRNLLIDKTSGPNTFSEVIVELMPYVVLKSIGTYFKLSWYIGRQAWFDIKSSGPMIDSVESDKIHIFDIQTEGAKHICKPELEYRTVLQNFFREPICIPVGTSVKIVYKDFSASIEFEHADFNITIGIYMLSSGSGLHPKNPYREMLYEKHGIDGDRYQTTHWKHFDGGILFSATFPFPERDVEMFNKYHHYSKSLKDLIVEMWDYEHTLTVQPGKDMLLVQSKLDDIIDALSGALPKDGKEKE